MPRRSLKKESEAIATLMSESNRVQGEKEKMAVSFSGGKDSLVVLDLATRIGIKKAVYCDTTADFDETLEYVDRVRDFYNIELTVVRGQMDFFQTIEHVGVPSRRARWCCEVHKYGPIAKYARERDIKAFVTGLRRDESKRRTYYTVRDQNPMIPVLQINPILDWTSEDVWEYVHYYNLPYNPLYDTGLKRVGCWCCPYKSKGEWEQMQQMFPEKMQQLEQVLSKQADKLKIKDKEKFVKKQGWTSWINPQKRRIVGALRPCEDNNGSDFDVVNIEFHGDKEKNAKKVARLLPVFTDLFSVTSDNRVKVQTYGIEKKNLKILVEKAANCVSCGACTSVCPTGALKVDELSVYVDESTCTKCNKCINGALLRGACIVRNYSDKPAAMVDLRK